MNDSSSVFIADTCIGGLSVVKSMWRSGHASKAVFMADYAINPLGVKSDAAIASVVKQWLSRAEQHSDTLLIACNTLSVRYHQLFGSDIPPSGLKRVISMLDCFNAMIEVEAEVLTGSKVLIIGTAFTANQSLYPDLLREALPGIDVEIVVATDLEHKIARFKPLEKEGASVFSGELRQALENTETAILACTCFPMVTAQLQSQFPGVTFLDPGFYCSGLLQHDRPGQNKQLKIEVTGKVVSRQHVLEFAKSYLDSISNIS